MKTLLSFPFNLFSFLFLTELKISWQFVIHICLLGRLQMQFANCLTHSSNLRSRAQGYCCDLSRTCFLTQVVVDKVCCEGGLLVFPPSVHGSICIRRIHRKNVSADAHQLRLSHQLPDGWGTRGQRSWQLLPGHPRLRPGVPGQFCFSPVLLQAGCDSGLQMPNNTIHISQS